MSKKIGVITLNGYFNYGNRLQNYALEMTLKKLENEVHTIRLDRNTNIQNVKGKISRIKQRITDYNNYNNNNKREVLFKKFSNMNLNETQKEYNINKDLSFLNSDYDKFIVGSDQVWNPSMNRDSDVYFLQFAEESKRVSYSASFGVSTFNRKTEQNYSKWLKEMSNISVREREGAEIVKELTNKEAEVLVDPTMLLSRKEWLSIALPAKNKPKGKYLLTYYLGAIPEQYQSQLKEIAEKNKLQIVNIGDPTDSIFFETGPSEFLDYINNASAFFTDSFHGVVFSIIFQTPFVVYERQSSGPSMYSRIETILDNFNMRDREAEGFDQDIFSMDFSGTQKVLEREYNKSINYLKEALRIEE